MSLQVRSFNLVVGIELVFGKSLFFLFFKELIEMVFLLCLQVVCVFNQICLVLDCGGNGVRGWVLVFRNFLFLVYSLRLRVIKVKVMGFFFKLLLEGFRFVIFMLLDGEKGLFMRYVYQQVEKFLIFICQKFSFEIGFFLLS